MGNRSSSRRRAESFRASTGGAEVACAWEDRAGEPLAPGIFFFFSSMEDKASQTRNSPSATQTPALHLGGTLTVLSGAEETRVDPGGVRSIRLPARCGAELPYPTSSAFLVLVSLSRSSNYCSPSLPLLCSAAGLLKTVLISPPTPPHHTRRRGAAALPGYRQVPHRSPPGSGRGGQRWQRNLPTGGNHTQRGGYSDKLSLTFLWAERATVGTGERKEKEKQNQHQKNRQ